METILRSTLQPITHNLPISVHQALDRLIGGECHKTLILDISVTEGGAECMKLLISKTLGLAIIGSSSIVKLPQIAKLLSSQSAEGLSFLTYGLETAAFVIGLAYSARSGFPFSTYGETAFLLIQNVVVAALILVLRRQQAAAGTWALGVAAVTWVLMQQGGGGGGGGELVGMKTMAWLQGAAGVLSVVSKVPQIWTVWREGGTGQLSAVAVFSYLVGSLSRIFTTLQEVDDKLILYGYVAGFIFNAVLAAQMVYYWNSGSKNTTGSSKGQVGRGGANNKSLSSDKEKPASAGLTTGARAKSPSTRRRG